MHKNNVNTIEVYGSHTRPAKDGIHTVEVLTEGGGGAAGEFSYIKAKAVILATGSEARMLPNMEPDTRILTNIEILSLNAIPKSLVIIGSGAVGSEFASLYKSFGSDVTLIEMLDRIVPVEDVDVSKELLRAFKKRGINCIVSAKTEKVEKTKDGVAVTYTADGKQTKVEAEKVLIAIGRAPRTDNVGVEKTKVKLDRGFVPVNEWMETAEPGVYAI